MQNSEELKQQLISRLNQIMSYNPIEDFNNELRNRLSNPLDDNSFEGQQNILLERQYRQAHPYWGYMKYDLNAGNPLRFPYELKSEIENFKKNFMNNIDYGER